MLTKQQKTDIVKQYTVMVKRIAYSVLRKMTAAIQLDDLIQAGMLGLIEASDRYDHNSGASFETFVGMRIYGSMIDEVRKTGWIPKDICKQQRDINAVCASLESKLFRRPTDSEMAESMGLCLSEFGRVNEVAYSVQVVLDCELSATDSANDYECCMLLDEYEQAEFYRDINKSYHTLPTREAQVIRMYYGDNKNMREIGNHFNVGESRVSLIHSAAIKKMRSILQQWA